MKTQAFNPFLPSYEYIPDAEPYVFGNRVYIYGSHDRFDGEDFCMNDYVCWSAPVDDLGAWKKEGIIYRSVQDPMNEDGSHHLFAPDMQVGEDGTLYGQKPGDAFNFDPGMLKDDDGKISSAYGTFMYQKEKTEGEEKHPYFTQDGEDREDNSNQYIANLQDGAWTGFKYFNIRESDRIKVCVRGDAEGEMLVQDEKDGEIRAVIPIHPSADWQWFEFCGKEQ